MSGAPGDFEDFVTARWRELHAVATVTTGNADDGARATASALAALGRRWAETVDEGAPTAAARVAVLSAALTAAGRAGATPRDADGPPGPPEPSDPAEVDDDGTRVALAAVLAAATPTARAALAVEHWWHETPALVAAADHTDVATVQADLSALRGRLAAAHAASLRRDEAQLGWALAAATIDTLEHAADSAPVSDPAALVEDARTRGTRRRRTRLAVVGAALAVAVCAATALAWPGAGNPTPSGPAPDSALWASVSTWSPRGPLVDDDTVRSIAADARAADPAARLLYAGRVGDTIALVMTGSSPADPTLPAGVPGPALGEGFDGGGAFLRLWTAAARLGPRALGPAVIEGDPTARTSDLVALIVEQDVTGAAPAVLVLTRPTVTEAYVTTNRLPQPDGSLRPIVHSLPLVDGVASYAGTSVAFAPRVAAPGYEGQPAGVGFTYDLALPEAGPGVDLADHQRRLLADVTGLPAGELQTTSVLEADVPSTAPDPDPTLDGHASLRLTVVTTLTPDGGRVRTSRLAATTTEGLWAFVERLAAVPATDPHALLPLPTSGAPGFVAVAPDGATAQLLTEQGVMRDSATIRGGLATLSSAADPLGATFRLRVLAPDGHVVYDAVPPEPQELAD